MRVSTTRCCSQNDKLGAVSKTETRNPNEFPSPASEWRRRPRQRGQQMLTRRHADVSETRWKEINLPHTSTSPVGPSATARITILNYISAEAATRRPAQAPLPCVAGVMCDLWLGYEIKQWSTAGGHHCKTRLSSLCSDPRGRVGRTCGRNS